MEAARPSRTPCHLKTPRSGRGRDRGSLGPRPRSPASRSPAPPRPWTPPSAAHLQKEAVCVAFKSGCLVCEERARFCLFNVCNGWTELVG